MHSRISRAPGIGNTRHSRIGDQRDFFARREALHQLGGAHRFVVLVITDERLLDFVMLQQDSGMPRVFRGDKVGLFQRFERAQSDDRRGSRSAWRRRKACSQHRAGIRFSPFDCSQSESRFRRLKRLLNKEESISMKTGIYLLISRPLVIFVGCAGCRRPAHRLPPQPMSPMRVQTRGDRC